MDACMLDRPQVRWIERCADRLKALDHSMNHMTCVQRAFDLLQVWPMLEPEEAAAAYMAPLATETSP